MDPNLKIDTLVIINLASDQLSSLKKALNQNQFYFTLVDNAGGLLENPTHTLFIGINSSRYDELIKLLHKNCKKQRTHIATQTQMEIHLQPHQPIIIEAETGGATILTLPVAYFEQY
jgi:uncharacterized protein YaaQ